MALSSRGHEYTPSPVGVEARVYTTAYADVYYSRTAARSHCSTGKTVPYLVWGGMSDAILRQEYNLTILRLLV